MLPWPLQPARPLAARFSRLLRALAVSMAMLTTVLEGKVEFPEELQEIIKHVHDTCVAKTGVSETDISNCEQGIFADDNKLKCYMFCLMEEASIAEEDGTVDYDMMMGIIPDELKDKVVPIIMACKHLDMADKDKCEKTFEVHKCCYEKDPELYILF